MFVCVCPPLSLSMCVSTISLYVCVHHCLSLCVCAPSLSMCTCCVGVYICTCVLCCTKSHQSLALCTACVFVCLCNSFLLCLYMCVCVYVCAKFAYFINEEEPNELNKSLVVSPPSSHTVPLLLHTQTQTAISCMHTHMTPTHTNIHVM